MTIPNDERIALEMKVNLAFSPAAPIDQRSLFAGRLQQITEIMDAVTQRGQHAIIFGERGVGKTSLANILNDLLKPICPRGLIVSKVNCDVTDTYSSIWKKVFGEIQVFHPKRGIGYSVKPSKERIDLVQLLGDEVSPDHVRHILSLIEPHIVVIIDEFDRVQNENTRTLLADTIKTLSDYTVQCTVVLVGVADSVDGLIREHLSVDRALMQVHMPRMSAEETHEIIEKGLQSVPMQIQNDALEYISLLSQGLPHYVHLLGQLSARRSLGSGRRTVQKDDVKAAISDAIHKAQQSILSAYHKATMSTRRETLYAQVLLACALAKVDSLGYFAASDVRDPMSQIMKRHYDIPAFARHLNDFCEAVRGPILQKTGIRRRFRFRFLNPLMQPYVVLQGLALNMIDEPFIQALAKTS
ncbi:MAG: ATP-binding protein [Dehalococcoidia bacterium]|nr:ATP-binding protein [Dehalococcoidia bacterium]